METQETHPKQELVNSQLKRQAMRHNGLRVDLVKFGTGHERLQTTARTSYVGYWIDRTGRLSYNRTKTRP